MLRVWMLSSLLLWTLSAEVMARAKVATVKRIRGKVTKLLPGSLQASILQIGEGIPQDTSVVTGKKSFAQLVFADNSTMNIGPNSKVLIEVVTKKKGSIINLLKGKIRNQVEKSSSNSKNKFFVKTRSAALGVRGTEFQTIYNPNNNVTNLLTYKGEVAMKKVEAEPVSDAGTDVVESAEKGEIDIRKAPRAQETQLEELTKSLEAKETVVVKQGQFSGVTEGIKKASLPVKVSPVQLNTLYQNPMMVEKSAKDFQAKDLKAPSEERLNIKPAAQEAPPEGLINTKTGDFAPKAGGFIDMKTGLYVPPAKDAIFDKKLGVFVPKDEGAIDKTTGQYQAPEGLKLDDKKGFVVDKRKFGKLKKEKKQELLAKNAVLNDQIGRDAVLMGKAPKKDSFSSAYTPLELITKDVMVFRFFTFSQTGELGANSFEGDRKIEAEGQKGFLLEWSHSSGGKWQPYTAIGRKTVSYQEDAQSDFNQGADDALMMSIGARRNLSSRWSILPKLTIEQDYIPVYPDTSISTTASTKELSKFTRPMVELILEWDVFKSASGRFSLDFDFGAIYYASKEKVDMELEGGFGSTLKLGSTFWFTRKYFGQMSLWNKTSSQKVKGNNFSADYSSNNSGLEFAMGLAF